MTATIQIQDFQNSQAHWDLRKKVHNEMTKREILKKDDAGNYKVKYYIYKPISSIAWRRKAKRPHFSNKAIG